jgi:predicted amidohydrolase
MKIAIAQLNATLADFEGNKIKILKAAAQAHELGCRWMVFPECSLFGYHPFDLLERRDLIEAQLQQLKSLQKSLPKGFGILVGAITRNTAAKGKPFYNSETSFLNSASSSSILFSNFWSLSFKSYVALIITANGTSMENAFVDSAFSLITASPTF